jgi:nicotinate-nucleotide adenylyltransferase
MPIVIADRPQWRLPALAAPAARALARHRINDRDARGLALAKPPAWLYLTLPLSPESSTDIRRAARGQP